MHFCVCLQGVFFFERLMCALVARVDLETSFSSLFLWFVATRALVFCRSILFSLSLSALNFWQSSLTCPSMLQNLQHILGLTVSVVETLVSVTSTFVILEAWAFL